jgi:DNA-binding transcriptional regulator LsrR (DeoR family)
VEPAEVQYIREAGVVGDICGQHYSLSGEWLDIDINHRAIGIDLDILINNDRVIGVAGSSQKGAAILGALRGRYVNILITDDQAAQKVLALNETNAGNG